MKVTSTGIVNGYWGDRFGKHGSDISPQGKAIRSVPFSIIDPPDADHAYDLDVYALDCTLDLQPGFYLNEMIHAMRGHVLTHARVTGKYRA